MLKILNDIRTCADLFAGEKLTTTEPYAERTVPEHPVWMEQPEPGYDKDWWIYRSSGPTNPRDVAYIVVGVLIVSFVIMVVW